MRRRTLLEALRRHMPADANEAGMTARMARFVEENEDCFSRALSAGHITGSAWIVDPDRSSAVLVYHTKLGRWLQPGGHCESGESAAEAAAREAAEETGIVALSPLYPGIFDIDIHPIPAKGPEPAHLHYDVRYAFVAPRDCTMVVSPESRAVKWVQLGEVKEINPDASMLRMVAKTIGSVH